MRHSADTAANRGTDVNADSVRRSHQGMADDAEAELVSSARFLLPSGLGRLELPLRILLGLRGNLAQTALARRLRDDQSIDVLEFDPSAADPAESLRFPHIDVAIVSVAGMNLTFAPLLHDPTFGFPEVVFVVDGGCPAQRLALLSQGYRHVISDDRLATWLPDQVVSLCTLARARRIVLASCTPEARETDLALAKVVSGSTSLHNAETHFRDTFLRTLLLQHGSRRKAAEAAGVPYRSFCEMLRKLHI